MVSSTDVHLHNPFAPEVKRDPHPYYEAWRTQGRVVWSEELRAWLVLGHHEMESALRDNATFSSANSIFASTRPEYPEFQSPINADDPVHRELRALVAGAFTEAGVRRRWAAPVKRLASALIEQGDPARFEVVSQLASPLPLAVIANILGIEHAGIEQLHAWSNLVMEEAGAIGRPGVAPTLPGAGPLEEHELLARWGWYATTLGKFFKDEVLARRRSPRDDLLSVIANARVGGRRLPTRAVISMCSLLLVTGNETTTALIANTIIAASLGDGLLASVRDRPERAGAIIEEVARWESPVAALLRRATRATQLGGVRIAADDVLVLLFGAANRDPAAYERPNEFIPARNPHHFAFGFGTHYCLGAPLARLEASSVLVELARRVDSVRLGRTPVTWRTAPFLRSPSSLEVVLRPRV